MTPQQKAAAKARKEAPRVLAGVDVDKAVEGLLKLPALAQRIPKRKNGRKLRVSVGHIPRAFSGRAWPYSFRIYVAAAPDAKPHQVLVTILHELVHIATPRASHGEEFRLVYRRALRQAWDIEINPDMEVGDRGLRAYAMDQLAEEMLAERISAGAVELYPPDPPAPKPERREVMAAVVERRAAHAATMLARAETRLKRAKTLHQKWAAKVRYYERAAAKKEIKGKRIS